MLDEKYANLSRRNALGWTFSNSKGEAPLGGPEKAAISQIAHEVLRSLSPNMPLTKPKVTGALVADFSVTVEERPPLDTAKFAKVGRNDPCPCGSGKKYKRCHGRP